MKIISNGNLKKNLGKFCHERICWAHFTVLHVDSDFRASSSTPLKDIADKDAKIEVIPIFSGKVKQPLLIWVSTTTLITISFFFNADAEKKVARENHLSIFQTIATVYPVIYFALGLKAVKFIE